MKHHTKIYFNFFNYSKGDFIPCEMENCGEANDIHHIDCKGMGGDPKGNKDHILNLMALCRKHHEELGDKKQFKSLLIERHIQFMAIHQPNKSKEIIESEYEKIP